MAVVDAVDARVDGVAHPWRAVEVVHAVAADARARITHLARAIGVLGALHAGVVRHAADLAIAISVRAALDTRRG